MEIHINCVNLFAIVQLSIRSFKSDNINNRKNKEQVSSLYKEGQINKKNPHVVKTFLYFRECLQIQISVHRRQDEASALEKKKYCLIVRKIR